jgi:hypothetical protein
MVPVAEEVENREAGRMFNSVFAAAGSIFSKAPLQAFKDLLQAIDRDIRNRQLEARGVEVDRKAQRAEVAAQAISKGFSKLGMRSRGKR